MGFTLTPLHHAVRGNKLALVDTLLNDGANINAAGRYFKEGCGTDYREVQH
jgi:ankyrin repeat protein